MKTYKERTDSVLKKVRLLKKRRAKIFASTAASCIVVVASFFVAVGMQTGAIKGDFGGANGAPEQAENASSEIDWEMRPTMSSSQENYEESYEDGEPNCPECSAEENESSEEASSSGESANEISSSGESAEEER